jgi:excisionase family DNA binding protein
MSRKTPTTEVNPAPQFTPNFTPRLLRISEAAFYLSCTYNFMEELIRSKTIPSAMLGKRRVVDIEDLNNYARRVIDEAQAISRERAA